MLVGKRVLELGAGTGYVGIGCFLLGADFVLCTDREKQVPLIQRNLQRNLSQNEIQNRQKIGAETLKVQNRKQFFCLCCLNQNLPNMDT